MGSLITISLILTSIAGIVTSLVFLWKTVVKPFYRFCKRLGRVVDVVSNLPEWCETVDESLQQIGPMKDELVELNKAVREHIDNKDVHIKER